MNNIQIFNNPQFGNIRTVTIHGEPWFVGKDIAEALGYTNSRDALTKRVDDEDKGGSKMRHPFRSTDNDDHQRIRTVFSHSFQ